MEFSSIIVGYGRMAQLTIEWQNLQHSLQARAMLTGCVHTEFPGFEERLRLDLCKALEISVYSSVLASAMIVWCLHRMICQQVKKIYPKKDMAALMILDTRAGQDFLFDFQRMFLACKCTGVLQSMFFKKPKWQLQKSKLCPF